MKKPRIIARLDVKGKNVLVTISGGNVDDDSFDKYIASA